jgi:hypothetical protein
MRDPYVYYAQSKAHPGDPMYSIVDTRKYALAGTLKGREADYIVFRFSPDGRCKVIQLIEPAPVDPDAGWKHTRSLCS